MSFNRIAVYGHRGFVASRVVPALIASGAPITVLHRSSSDTSSLPKHVKKIQVDVLDEDDLVAALQDIDIVLSLVGDEGTDRQYGFVKAIPRTNVKLFVPSDFCLRYCEQGMAVGIDLQNNVLVYTGNSANERVTMCTMRYVAAAYVDIFTTRPIHTIQNRTFTLSELAPTGMEIAAVMKEKNGREPSISTRSLDEINQTIEGHISNESNLAVPSYCRKMWGTGEMMKMLPDDLWEVKDYKKATLQDLVIGGELESYRALPDQVLELLRRIL
ncbi:hypothetical protein H9Q72_001352 [Fusarium xylarioides]|uniref:NAD(P)-binding domain-containing protein n=1 Tax=Fusarium xylarioides TaxID=221167 RepID=A0A9P7I1N2_9HYPO|nr:hypothetical protein H9Q70_002178 [Fusarium xylarioides]KAG5772534.1 hypothetical protein H9Q72_001352 [Fusarium xylarioides]